MMPSLVPCRPPLIAAAAMLALGWAGLSFADLYGVLRTVMMVLGGFVVVAIVLVVAVAIISGVLGMVGRLRKPGNTTRN